jgi:hypothetical protein
MRKPTMEVSRCVCGEQFLAKWTKVAALLLAGATGCGPAGRGAEEAVVEGETALRRSAYSVQQAGSDNGISLNGISLNGISLNGISLNGISLNGLSATSFRNWFNQDAARHDELMKYVVKCAVASGQSRTFTNPVTNTTHVWPGLLGLAPSWAGGSAATVAERQVVTACLLAHVNEFNEHVPISLLGLDGAGNALPFTSQELLDYPEQEACFFGDIFGGSEVYVGSDGLALTAAESTLRVCSLIDELGNSQCAQLAHVGSCADYCTKDSTNTYYTSCTYRDVTYRPITTRMRAQEIHSCGDGVCQASERAGTGTTADSCFADCGS